MAPPDDGLRVDTDVLRDYGSYCARLGDDVDDLAKHLLDDTELPTLAWHGGHLSGLLKLQEALDEMRDTYAEARFATRARLARIGELLLDIGATLHTTADTYDTTDREHADWLAAE
ncbi:MAG: hypothetical protein ACRDT2_15020 [Natronosporangium sp.]